MSKEESNAEEFQSIIAPLKLPQAYETGLGLTLESLGFSLNQVNGLAATVQKISDHFVFLEDGKSTGPTPWDTKIQQASYLAYFATMNLIRNMHVFKRVEKFLDQLSFDSVFEVGSGSGASSWAAAASLHSVKNWHFIEASPAAAAIHQQLNKHSGLSLNATWQKELPVAVKRAKSPSEGGSLLFISYTYNEMTLPLSFFKAFDHVLIVEPSTFSASQKLIQLRESLLTEDFYALAPCTHQMSCPMLNSVNHWCHDRAHWVKPNWFQSLESQIKMNNKTLPYSYLLMSRHKPNSFATTQGRIVGDELIEKGKTRWAFCRSSKLERLASLHRHKSQPTLKRGDLANLADFEVELKNEEIRIQSKK